MKRAFWNTSRRAAPIALSLLLLGGMAVDRARLGGPRRDAGPYHQRVQALAESVPYRVGDWIGDDVEMSAAASSALKPNVLISRQYQNLRTGEQAALVIVQCRDARHLLGHYPPVCYVASGWENQSAHRRDWRVGGQVYRGTEYVFARQVQGRTVGQHVVNFMLLPDGRTAPDMVAVNAVAQDPRRKFFGAAQVQVLTDVQMSRDTRQRVLRDLMVSNTALFDAIRSGTGDQIFDDVNPAEAEVGATSGRSP